MSPLLRSLTKISFNRLPWDISLVMMILAPLSRAIRYWNGLLSTLGTVPLMFQERPIKIFGNVPKDLVVTTIGNIWLLPIEGGSPLYEHSQLYIGNSPIEVIGNGLLDVTGSYRKTTNLEKM